jgi:hypothetical protein
MPTDDREQQFERALARHLRNAAPDSSCPDAEILAAYHERTLSPDEMARWKEHVAGCQRCQESLALVEQTEGVAREEWESEKVLPLVEKSRPEKMQAVGARIPQGEEAPSSQTMAAETVSREMRRPRWRWIVPVGALAATVFVWVGVRESQRQRTQSVESVQVAQSQPPAPQAPATAYEAADQLKKEQPPAQNSNQAFRSQEAFPAPSAKMVSPKATQPAGRPSPSPPPAIGSEISGQKDLELFAAGKAASTEPPAPLPRDIAPNRADKAAAPSAADATAPVGAMTGAIANRPAEGKMKAPVPSAAETVEVQGEGAPSKTTASQFAWNKLVAADLVRQANEDRHYILAPGGEYAWHVGEAGRIEHTSDFGSTWQPQKSGVTTDLTTGSAPSAKVCWIVGKVGTVLLTTDGGKHWKQVSSPIREDLGGVHTTDALHASIWDVSNRTSFDTVDGGATWKRTSSE